MVLLSFHISSNKDPLDAKGTAASLTKKYSCFLRVVYRNKNYDIQNIDIKRGEI